MTFPPFIHPQAIVDMESIVGNGSKVWQFTSILRGTVIGEDCNVGACVTLTGARFGDRCKISSGVVMGPGFEIGDDVFIGPNVVLANDMWPFAETTGYDDVSLRHGRLCVRIESFACIGANAVILPGVTIGARAVVAAGAVVERNVPPDMCWRRNGYIGPVPVDWRGKRMRWIDQ